MGRFSEANRLLIPRAAGPRSCIDPTPTRLALGTRGTHSKLADLGAELGGCYYVQL